MKNDNLKLLFQNALFAMNGAAAEEALHKAKEQMPALQFIENYIVPPLQLIGDKWEKGDISLAQVYMAGKICEKLVDEILPPAHPSRKNQPKMGIAVLEDYHLLGKRIVYAILRASGYELLDYKHSISVEQLVKNVIADKIDTLLISTLMLPSALRIKNVREELDKREIQIRIFVGGAPFIFDDNLWKEVGADAGSKNASDILQLID